MADENQASRESLARSSAAVMFHTPRISPSTAAMALLDSLDKSILVATKPEGKAQ
jgi:hypothetical protein